MGINIAGTGAGSFGIYDLTGASNRLFINTSGQVGIGVTSPTSKLHVVGLPTYASDAAAGTGGLTSGAFYLDASGGVHAKL
jgi:hypothetical protein